MDKTALEHLLSSYNWWMGISTIAVAIGILGEYVAHFVFEEEVRRNKREMAVSLLFGVMVLGGVVGEYIFGKKLTQVSEQLQQIADLEVAQSNKDAAAARKDAEFARKQSATTYERAAKAEQHAADENARAAKALEAAEIARKNAEGFRLQIAQANERAANAERETEQLKGRMADRSLTDEQVARVVARLKPFAGQEFEIIAYWDNPETMGIANRVYAALLHADWKFIPLKVASWLGGTGTGILANVFSDGSDSTKKAAQEFVLALQEQGLAAKLAENNNPHTTEDTNKIRLNFMAKP